MLLKSNFYSFSLIEQKDVGIYLLKLQFNELHPIFNGHFPNNPVVPGVSMVQIVKEIIETLIYKEIRLEKVSIIKFLKVLDPRIKIDYCVQITLQQMGANIKCDAQINDETSIYFKMKSAYTIL
jgi:3-hydroxyacyl-[acyl-carrier-protein] dehydratase